MARTPAAILKTSQKNQQKLKQNRHQKRNNTPTQKPQRNHKKTTIPIIIRSNTQKKV
jgi:hypothetical protein